MKFTNAITRQPAKSMVNGITTANLGKPDYQKALTQHQAYVQALADCGLQVTVLNADEDYPDSVFIEDVALLTPDCAILTRPGADSRKGEVGRVRKTIESLHEPVYEISAPGCVEAGDIRMVGSHFYIGLSERTDPDGARQVINLLQHHNMSGSTIEMKEMLHLKTGLSYLENNNLLICGEFAGRKEFSEFNQVVVTENEAYAANSVWINGRVLVAAGHPKTSQKIRNLGYEIIELEMSEFQKLDGGLSCLSLRF